MSTQTAPDLPADQYFESDGARLRWRRSGSGAAVVLLHGWALDLEYWDAVTTALTPRFTVLRFDRSGFGLSQGPADVQRNVGDLAALLNATGLARVVLVGMSQGARLAIHFALQYPARTRALVLDGAPALDAESELSLDEYRHALESQGLAALQARILQHPLMQLAGGDAAVHARLAGIVARYRGLDLQHPVARRRAPQLGAITAPTLILNGNLDSASRRAAGRELQAAIPGAQRVELPAAGHLAALDGPSAYAQAVTTFCGELPP